MFEQEAVNGAGFAGRICDTLVAGLPWIAVEASGRAVACCEKIP